MKTTKAINTNVDQRLVPAFNKLFDSSAKRGNNADIARYLLEQFVNGVEPGKPLPSKKALSITMNVTTEFWDKLNEKREAFGKDEKGNLIAISEIMERMLDTIENQPK